MDDMYSTIVTTEFQDLSLAILVHKQALARLAPASKAVRSALTYAHLYGAYCIETQYLHAK